MRSSLIGAIGLAAAMLVALAARSRGVKGRKRAPKASRAMHVQARDDAANAFREAIHAEPDEDALRMVMAVALHETTYGAGWKGAGEGSFNMGAIHATKSWDGLTFPGTDTSPTSTGSAVAYEQAFRAYPNAIEGWKDLVSMLMLKPAVRAAAESGDPMKMARAMRAAKYYEGSGKNEDERIRGYAQALADGLLEIDSNWVKP